MSLATRKTIFKQAVLDRVLRIPGGSRAYRAYLHRTALGVVDDLLRLGLLPITLKHLTPDKIARLVYLWKDKKLAHKTILNRLAVLRAIADTDHPPLFAVPGNQTFGISIRNTLKTLPNLNLKLNPDRIQNPDIRSVCLLQYLFGLKKREAVRSFGLLIIPEALIVPRLISFNKKERRITIINETQVQLLNHLSNNPLSNCHKALSLLHHDLLKQANIEDPDYFRQFYIVNRYKALCLDVSPPEALKRVQQETGYCSLRQIKGVLSCLENF